MVVVVYTYFYIPIGFFIPKSSATKSLENKNVKNAPIPASLIRHRLQSETSL